VERSLILAKPDTVQRGLVGEVISRFERRGLQLVALKLMQVSRELAERHYEEHAAKPFFAGLVDYITSSPLVAMVFAGPNAVEICRAAIGATNPAAAAPGSIRGDLALTVGRNLVHGSDSQQSAQREISLFFPDERPLVYARDIDRWLVE